MRSLKERTGQYYIEIVWLLLHAGLGLLFLLMRPLARIFVPVVLVYGLIYLIKTRNRNNEVLIICGYLAGADVFFRMTNGLIFSEEIKYSIILFMLIAIVFGNISNKGYWYIAYLVLLIPGIFYSGFNTLSYEAEFRKIIAFNLSGPVCAGICALYCIGKRVTYSQLSQILYWFLMPVISMLVYITFFQADIRMTFMDTTSNFAVSGGYGPNQVSVVLGVGMFILLYRYLFYSPVLWLKVLNIAILAYTIYRGLITFSRGGVLTALFGIIAFFLSLTLLGREKVRGYLLKSLGILGIVLLGVWGYSNVVSNGLLVKRYYNQDAAGRDKEDELGGREELISYELMAFNESPFLGIGVGNNKFYREDASDIEAATHNEITRLMAEHGMFGIFAFAILFLVPLFNFWLVHRNAFALVFFIFWFLTINHNATRIAVPSFLYGLSVIILYNEKSDIHRQSVIGEG